MNEFTWINMYKEIAAELKNYKDRQQDLIKILTDLQKQGLPTISLMDKNQNDEDIPLTEIDPFTFFANFNRRIKEESRIEILRQLKSYWKLGSAIPTDFLGTPVVHALQSRFFMYKKDRGDQDIHLLWELFSQALDDNISPQTFDAVLELKLIKFNITMGLFWINPERYLNLDSVNRKYLADNSLTITEIPDFQTYIEYMERTKRLFQKPFFEISHNAWLVSNPPPPTESPPSGRGVKYWLYAPGEGGKHWNEFYSGGMIAIGWDYLGDLKPIHFQGGYCKGN